MIVIWQTRRIYLMAVFTQFVSRNWQALKQKFLERRENIKFQESWSKAKEIFCSKIHLSHLKK